MPKFQYIGEGHTLIQTAKAAKEKVKVVQGEIIDIEDGLFADSRLMLAGFQKIADGIEDVIDAAVDAAKTVADAVTGENAPETSENAPEDVTPAEGTENAPETTPEAPAVTVTAEDDGKNAITVAVEAPKLDRAAIIAELTALGVEFKPVGSKTTDLAALLEEAKAAK